MARKRKNDEEGGVRRRQAKVPKDEPILISSDSEEEGKLPFEHRDGNKEEKNSSDDSGSDSEEEDSSDDSGRKEDEKAGAKVVEEVKEAARFEGLPLWGEEGERYSPGHLRDLAPGHVELAAAAAAHYGRYREEESRAEQSRAEFGCMMWRRAEKRCREAMDRAGKNMRTNLDRAIVHWRVALAKAEVAGDTAGGLSIARNLLVAHTHLVARILPSLRLHIYREAFVVFATALKLSGDNKHLLRSSGERKGIVEVFEGLVENLWAELSQLAATPRELVLVATTMCQPLDRWNKAVENTDAMGLLKLRVGQVIFNRAAVAVAEREFQAARYLLKELYTVVEEAKGFLGGNAERLQEADMLGRDAEIHTDIADAIQQLHLADGLLDEAVRDSESLDMMKIADCMDTYRRAAALVASQDVEVVCIAYTKIARIRLKVMKDGISRTRGKEYLAEVMTLSQGLTKNLHSLDWFNLATSLLKEIREQAQKKEDEEWNNKRKVVMEEIKEELAKLEAHEADSDQELVDFLFLEMPPRHRPEGQWRPLQAVSEDKDWKKVMARLVTVYHPDRVDKAKYDDKYYVLCEEVCKKLIKRYTAYKG